jgi:hypothetical protein
MTGRAILGLEFRLVRKPARWTPAHRSYGTGTVQSLLVNVVGARGGLSILIRAATGEDDSNAHYGAESEAIFHFF